MGEDKCRGLLEFSDGKKLGERGLYWLKIHVSNKMGRDKLSFPERLGYVEENLDYILQMGRKPLEHREWLD